ncbi:hypothetical protein HDE_00484 [Halotydeus destructor]|nr:hypothetical protein HDE_00484 [Halotydeus destructor]
MDDCGDFMKDLYHGLENNTYVLSTLDLIQQRGSAACQQCLEKDRKISDLEETLNQVVEANIQINKVVSQLISKRQKKSRSKSVAKHEIKLEQAEQEPANTSGVVQLDKPSARRPSFLKAKAILLPRHAVDISVMYQLCLGCGSTYRPANAANHFLAFKSCRGMDQKSIAACDVWTLEDENNHNGQDLIKDCEVRSPSDHSVL